jgi:TPR repeat protein
MNHKDINKDIEFKEAHKLYMDEEYATAFEIWKKYADEGDVSCQTQIGWMYFIGEGVIKDLDESLKWMEIAANSGDMQAQFYLSKLYMAKNNISESIKWLKESEKQGYVPAVYRMGYMYENGYGVNKDISEAYSLYCMAAGEGHVFAKRKKAFFMMKGIEGFGRIFLGVILFFVAFIQGIKMAFKDPFDDSLRI